MSIEQYVKDDTIDKKIFAELVAAKDNKVIIYGAITSVYKNPWHLSSGFFESWTVFDTKHILTPNRKLARNKFDELYTELCTKLGPFNPRFDTRYNKDKKIKPTYLYADFGTGYEDIPKISFLNTWDLLSIMQYGTDIRLSLKKLEFPLESICYEPKSKSICYTHQDSYEIDYYWPITLE